MNRSVARIVRWAVKPAGLDKRAFSGHSMRAGFVTSSLGVDIFKVMKVTRHRKVDKLEGYDRREIDFENHAGGHFL